MTFFDFWPFGHKWQPKLVNLACSPGVKGQEDAQYGILIIFMEIYEMAHDMGGVSAGLKPIKTQNPKIFSSAEKAWKTSSPTNWHPRNFIIFQTPAKNFSKFRIMTSSISRKFEFENHFIWKPVIGLHLSIVSTDLRNFRFFADKAGSWCFIGLRLPQS